MTYDWCYFVWQVFLCSVDYKTVFHRILCIVHQWMKWNVKWIMYWIFQYMIHFTYHFIYFNIWYHFICHFSHYWFIHERNIVTHKWLAPTICGFLAQLVTALHLHRKVKGANPVKSWSFQASLCNYQNCLHNCENLSFTWHHKSDHSNDQWPIPSIMLLLHWRSACQ